jgi:hypothetical protein
VKWKKTSIDGFSTQFDYEMRLRFSEGRTADCASGRENPEYAQKCNRKVQQVQGFQLAGIHLEGVIHRKTISSTGSHQIKSKLHRNPQSNLSDGIQHSKASPKFRCVTIRDEVKNKSKIVSHEVQKRFEDSDIHLRGFSSNTSHKLFHLPRKTFDAFGSLSDYCRHLFDCSANGSFRGE